jgi:hypothetical protein
VSATQALGWFARSASHTRALAFDFPKPKCFGLRGTLRPRHALSHDRGVDVERHGSESYFALGEGLLGESLGGRESRFPASVDAVVALLLVAY